MLRNNGLSGNFYGSSFKIGVTSLHEYFPAYTVFENQRAENNRFYSNRHEPQNLMSELITDDVYLYRKPERNPSGASYASGYPQLYTLFYNYAQLGKWAFTYERIEHTLNVMKGYIADERGNILLMVTTNSFNLIDTTTRDIKTEHLKVLVSTEFIKNPIYKNVFKKIEKDILRLDYENDIEVVFTTSEKIERIFTNNFEVQYRTIDELATILETEPGDILNYSFEPEVEDSELPF